MDQQQKQLLEELLFSGEKKLSFAKLLYFGGFHASSVFPFPEESGKERELSEEFLTKIEKFAEENVDGDKIDKEGIPDSLVKGMADIGLLGLTVPKEYGGLGLSQVCYAKAVKSISRRCSSTALFVNVHQSIGLRSLLLFGSDEQKKKWLVPLASGKKLAAFSLTEPNAGSDASGVETRATYIPEKNVYRINGLKQWTTNGSIADVLTVMAQTEIDGKDKITAFLVTPDMPGFRVRDHSLEKLGMRGTKTANLAFDNMEVPAENILGPKGAGLRVALTVLDYGRTTFGAMCTGAAEYLVERAIDHATTRQQFHRSLSSFPLVKQKLSLISALAYAMDASTQMTAGLVDRDEEEFMLESAILKVFTSDSLWQILYDTMQIFGGRSFFTSEPFERMLRDARLNTIGEGSNEVLRAFIAVVGMRDVGMQLQGVLHAFKHPFSEMGMIKSFTKQCFSYFGDAEVPSNFDITKPEAKKLGRVVKKFSRAIVRLLGSYGEDIVERQLILDRVCNIVMAIYTTSAVLSKINAQIEKQNGNITSLTKEITTAKFYCEYAFSLIDHNFATLFSNNDPSVEKLSDIITGAATS